MGFQDPVTSNTETTEDRANIISKLWQHHAQASAKDSRNWNAFFTYYTDECKSALEERGNNVTVRKHQDIIDIAIQLEHGQTKESLYESLFTFYAQKTQTRQDDEIRKMIEGSIRLVVRLVAMVDIGPISPRCIQGYTPLDWADKQQNVVSLFGNHFTRKTSVAEFTKFGRLFNALNIQRYAGLKIYWTDNLNNHLRLVNEDTGLCIFHHVAFLKSQQSKIFPVGFLEETLYTLQLLFPRNDKPTQKWLKHEANSKVLSTNLDLGLLDLDRLKSQNRTIEEFTFWRDELIELKERFEQPDLASISQLWYDRRNRSQWMTFWFGLVIAVATLFGLVLAVFQTAFSAVQVYIAYNPGSSS